jgi:hypothetical protein
MSSLITFAVNQPYGAPTGVTTPGGGSWTGETISCRVVAWQTAAETDVDMAGFDRATVALFNGIVVTAGDSVVIVFTPPTEQYDHLAFYYQVAATWNPANAARKCSMDIEQTSETSYKLTIDDDDNTATITFGAVTSATISPVQVLKPQTDKKVRRGWNGKLIVKSSAITKLVDTLTIISPMGSCTSANYDKILRWIKYGIPVSLTDSADGGYSPYISVYQGKIDDTDYLKSPGKNDAFEFTLSYMVESES